MIHILKLEYLNSTKSTLVQNASVENGEGPFVGRDINLPQRFPSFNYGISQKKKYFGFVSNVITPSAFVFSYIGYVLSLVQLEIAPFDSPTSKTPP